MKCPKCNYELGTKSFEGKGGLIFFVEGDGRLKIKLDRHMDLESIGIFESLDALYLAVEESKRRRLGK
jgi:hypothetical protein